jgi:phthiodiolone/phenolphthiodiolone dimycocerosates ketoreductase
MLLIAGGDDMTRKLVETAIPLAMDRYTPPRLFAESAKKLADSAVVDYQQPWDQLTSWWPNALWNADNTPGAAVLQDCDSWADVYALSAYAAAATDHRLGAAISLDAVRHGPAETIQTMLTLNNMTEGKTFFMIGGGEQKQCKPFGWKRSEGLGRMEDLMRINTLMWDCEGPFDFEGNFTTLNKAWLGKARQHRPKIWALGGGPKLMEVATKYADGFATMAPFVFDTPEYCADRITDMKAQIASHGRDPEQFGFGIFAATLLHEDPAVIDAALDNPLFRWMATTMGRINMNDWDRAGIEPPMPRDWSYATKLMPTHMCQAEIDDIVARGTREMSEKTWFTGTAAEVAAQLTPYIDAGVTWINIIDALPMVLPVEEAGQGLARQIEVCRLRKKH